MKRRSFCAILPGAALLPSTIEAQPATRERLLFDHDWKFLLGDPAGAEAVDFNTAAWRAIDLPHDWSIEGRIDPQSPVGGSGGYFPVGIAWYRRTFTAPRLWSGKRVSVEFEGVYMNANVYINGHDLGMHPYGYTTFFHDLTPHLKPGADNVLAIRVDQSKQRNSRWYSGSGIYRHVWLHATAPLHVAQWGTSIATIEATGGRAKISVKTRVANESAAATEVTLQTVIQGPGGAVVARSNGAAGIQAGDSVEISQEIAVDRPALWSPEEPALYRAITSVTHAGKAVDEVSAPFGIRTVEWSAEKGFVLNGKSIKMNGGCVHHDNGALGAAAFDRAEERRVEILKASGFNAIRTSHNPPSPAFLDACDRLGMLVMDESFDCWSRPKNPQDYNVVFKDWWQRDIEAMVRRDRNHPSVVMWSIGNEVPERGQPLGAEEAKSIAGYLRSIDGTRPVTSALNDVPRWTDTDGFYAALDAGGYNYNLARHAADHTRAPSRVMLCTESFPKVSFDDWAMVEDFPYIVGSFVWTAIDYLGESGLGRWYFRDPKDTTRESYGAPFPCHGADCGDIDITGHRRAVAHYRNILWDRGEKLYLGVKLPAPEGKEIYVTRWGSAPVFQSWTWPGMEGKPLDVEVYSRAELVRLYLDDKLIGEAPTTRAQKFIASFQAPYAPGVLKAAAVQGGQTIAESVLRTAGAPVQVKLTVDRTQVRATGQDLCFITVEAVDAHGLADPNAEHAVTFALAGPGSIAAVSNADLMSEELYQGTQRKLFRGRALVVVRSARKAGAITLTASAAGLKPASTRIASQA